MVRKRDIEKAVRDLEPSLRAVESFRMQFANLELSLGNCQGREHLIRLRAPPAMSFFALNPLSNTLLNEELQHLPVPLNDPCFRLHCCLGDLVSRPLGGDLVSSPTGFLVTKEFHDSLASSRSGRLWLVQDFTDRAVLCTSPRDRRGELLKCNFSCAKIARLEKGHFQFQDEATHGFNFRCLQAGHAANKPLVSDCVMEDGEIDEELFQDHAWEPWTDQIYSAEFDRQKAVAEDHINPKSEAVRFVRRLNAYGRRRISNFGEVKASDAINSLTINSTNKDLRRIRDRQLRETDAPVDISVRCPDGTIQQFKLRWFVMDVDVIKPLDGVPYSPADYVKKCTELGIEAPPVSEVELESYQVPFQTAIVLDTGHHAAEVILPVGRIFQDGITFFVVRMLKQQEYWIISNPYWNTENADIEETAVSPQQRVETFPRTNVRLSVGRLSGLFASSPAVLEVEGTQGFSLREVMRIKGVMEAV